MLYWHCLDLQQAPSLQVSLTLNLSTETSHRCLPPSHQCQSYRKKAPPFYFEIKVRSWSSFIACCGHKTDALSFCSKDHPHHFEHQSSPILFHICPLTSLLLPCFDSCSDMLCPHVLKWSEFVPASTTHPASFFRLGRALKKIHLWTRFFPILKLSSYCTVNSYGNCFMYPETNSDAFV